MDLSLSKKTFVVTGATSGIGLEVARQLVDQGASVIGLGRSPERCRTAGRGLRSNHPDASVTFLTADLSLQSEVRQAAAEIAQVLESSGKSGLDGLVNNAGTFTYWFSQTAEGFETQWAVNHLAPFLFTHLLLPFLQAAPAARVVTVSSGSHYRARLKWDDIQLRRCYNGLRMYGQTKLANVLFSAEFNRRQDLGSSVRAFAADPGLVRTDIGLKNTPLIARWVWSLRRSGGVPPSESAHWIVYLLTESGLAEEAGNESEQVYWKEGQPKPPSRYSLNPQYAARLWALSAKMCGIDREGNQ